MLRSNVGPGLNKGLCGRMGGVDGRCVVWGRLLG